MPSSASHPSSLVWQRRLEDICRRVGIDGPDYQVVSERRGGRTAWSSVVNVYGRRIEARYWYDGKNLNNAKEDAAEVAYTWLAGLARVH